MLTTCPECRTTFRIAHDQLEIRRGLVRCGYCRAVFNAYDTLLPEFEPPTRAEASAIPQVAYPEEALAEVASEPAPSPVPSEPAVIDTWREESGPAPAEDPFLAVGGEVPRLDMYQEVSSLGQEDRPAPESPLPFLSPDETPDAILLSDLPTRARIEPETGTGMRYLFGFLSFMLIVALFGQLAYFLRGPIAEWLPESRPVLEQACHVLGCTVPLNRQLELLKVESSSLETDPEQPTRAKLKVNFSNRSRSVQSWPCFVLRLSDLKNSPLAQRVFWPKDYLPKTKSESAGMAPMSELEFQLDLDLGGLSASGYEVKPQYP
ncbi:MAG: DUF3426 domain-containing protein [Parasulfuritortus sp.]|nr:DUF3426 domain-containing protein [Parasulfuritortus sp.]